MLLRLELDLETSCVVKIYWSMSWCRQFSSWLHPPSYRDFLQILMVQHLYFFISTCVQLQKLSHLAWKQHVLVVPYIAEFEVLKFLP